MWFSNLRIILASQSPRRAQLLSAAGIPFIVRTRPIEEIFPAGMPTGEVAEFLAREKARAAAGFLEEERDVILAADSIVLLGEVIFGKPSDREEAIHILRRLSGRTHRVITGVCLLSREKERVFSGITDVTFEKLSLPEIEYYVDHYRPYDKAGAYAIQEWIGMVGISRIEGTFTNVMGLPVDLLYEELKGF